MLFELVVALLLGILAGIVTGILPGIHINLIGSLLLAVLAVISFPLHPIIPATFIVAMAITHTFIDFIPSIYLGCPDTDTELSVLPGHHLLRQGKGHEAVLLTLFGGLSLLTILIILSPLLIATMPKVFPLIKRATPYILIIIIFILIFQEKEKIKSCIVLLLSGALGFLALNNSVNEPLLPLLTGFFGASGLIISMREKTKIPDQQKILWRDVKPSLKEYFPVMVLATFIGPCCGFLPSLTSGHAATLSSAIKKMSQRQLLLIVGAFNTAIMLISFLTIFAIQKSRSGSAATIQEILPSLTIPQLTWLLMASLIAGVIAFFIGSKISSKCSSIIPRINYQRISLITLIFISIIVIFFSHFRGLIVFLFATGIGIYGIKSEIKRTNFMGCLLIPVIIFYLTNP